MAEQYFYVVCSDVHEAEGRYFSTVFEHSEEDLRDIGHEPVAAFPTEAAAVKFASELEHLVEA